MKMRLASTKRFVTTTCQKCRASVPIIAVALVVLSASLDMLSADARSPIKELSPRAKLESLVDHRQFETDDACEHAAARCASLLQSIEDGKVEFIQPMATGKFARTTLERMCGSKYLAFYQEDPHDGSPFGPVITAKGPITLYQLPDLAKKFPGRKLYLARVEDDVQLDKPFDDGHLDVFSMPNCQRLWETFLEKSERYAGGTPTTISRNDWVSEPVIVGSRVFLLAVYPNNNADRLYIRLVSALDIRPNSAEIYTFHSN